MKASEDPMSLYDSIIVTCEIHCDNCNNESECDEVDPEEYFYKEGWRATAKGRCYCPQCCLKKLKRNAKKKTKTV